MTAVYIILGIFLFFAFVFITPLSISVVLDGELSLTLGVWFLRFGIIPKKKKKINLKKFSKKKFDRLMAKENAASALPAEKKKKSPKSDETEEGGSVLELLNEAKSLVIDVVKNFLSHITTKLVKIDITVGADDAAKSALLYGAVSQTAAYILEFLRASTKMRENADSVNVRANFLSSESSAYLNVVFRVRVFYAVKALLRLAIGYIRMQVSDNKKNGHKFQG